MNVRKVKVQRTHTPRSFFPPRRNARTTAKLTISGRWLEQAGFTAGTHAHIELTPQGLLIRPVIPFHLA